MQFFFKNIISKFVKVVDVFIPRKLNKVGKRFGFIGVHSVSAIYNLIKYLNLLWIGTYKLRAFESRFGKYVNRNIQVGGSSRRKSQHISLNQEKISFKIKLLLQMALSLEHKIRMILVLLIYVLLWVKLMPLMFLVEAMFFRRILSLQMRNGLQGQPSQ